MRAAILGGTFNPPHYGHLRLAEEVREALSYEKVIFMPSFVPPHKDASDITDAGKRLEMTRLAVSGNPYFEVSDMEIKRGGVSYTVETVRELILAGIEPAIIVGSDLFSDITTWCEYESLFMLADFIVAGRPGSTVKKPAEALPVALARKFWYDREDGAYKNDAGKKIVYADTTPLDISSSAIREMARRAVSVRYLVPEAVERYMLQNSLYK